MSEDSRLEAWLRDEVARRDVPWAARPAVQALCWPTFHSPVAITLLPGALELRVCGADGVREGLFATEADVVAVGAAVMAHPATPPTTRARDGCAVLARVALDAVWEGASEVGDVPRVRAVAVALLDALLPLQSDSALVRDAVGALWPYVHDGRPPAGGRAG